MNTMLIAATVIAIINFILHATIGSKYIVDLLKSELSEELKKMFHIAWRVITWYYIVSLLGFGYIFFEMNAAGTADIPPNAIPLVNYIGLSYFNMFLAFILLQLKRAWNFNIFYYSMWIPLIIIAVCCWMAGGWFGFA